MRYTETDIKNELLENLEQLQASEYPEDLLSEWADSAVPIYYSDTLNDWRELSLAETDRWQELGAPSNEAGIFDLMRIDLYLHYQDAYTRIYAELTHDLEEEAN